MRKYVFYIFLLVGIVLIFYLSWVPDASMAKAIKLPTWLTDWADDSENETIRTGVPFLGLGLLIGLHLRHRNTSFRGWSLSLLLLTIVGVLSELGQMFLPFRYSDYRDVLWAFYGSLAGLFFGHILWEMFNRITKK